MQDLEQILKTSYPKTVYDAVRYGYQYRKVSETVGENLHFSLGDPSSVVLWIASAVASGVVYDVIKSMCRKILSYCKKHNCKLDEETNTILNDEKSLREFTVFIKEYYSHSMKISERQEKYIKEEVIADVSAEETGKIYKETNRFVLTIEEYKQITKIASSRAEELIKRRE